MALEPGQQCGAAGSRELLQGGHTAKCELPSSCLDPLVRGTSPPFSRYWRRVARRWFGCTNCLCWVQGCMYRVTKPLTSFASKVAAGEVEPEQPTQEVSWAGLWGLGLLGWAVSLVGGGCALVVWGCTAVLYAALHLLLPASKSSFVHCYIMPERGKRMTESLSLMTGIELSRIPQPPLPQDLAATSPHAEDGVGHRGGCPGRHSRAAA